jgi:LacI family transcriptional regulator
LGILKAADELHISIPDRLSLIGFDNIPSTALPRIELTTVEQPKREMAIQAVDMLRDKIEHGTQGYVHQILLPTLIKRSTCRSIL